MFRIVGFVIFIMILSSLIMAVERHPQKLAAQYVLTTKGRRCHPSCELFEWNVSK